MPPYQGTACSLVGYLLHDMNQKRRLLHHLAGTHNDHQVPKIIVVSFMEERKLNFK